MKNSEWIAMLPALTLLSTPATTAAGDYLEPDSAWKVLENLQTAYAMMDIDGFLACLDEDLEFVLFYPDSATGETVESRWGRDVEEEFHRALFDEAENIEFTLLAEDPGSIPEAGSDGSLKLERGYSLQITTEGDFYSTSGRLVFVCRPDTSGDWTITEWWDVTGE